MADYYETSHKTLAVRIADKLRDEILSKKVAPGSRITAKEIADAWKTSQVPVREAFSILAGEGLVEINPYRGATVMGLSQERMDEVSEIVGAMVVLLCKRCLNIGYSEELLEELYSINRELQALAERLPDDERFFSDRFTDEYKRFAIERVTTNIRFHRALYSLAKASETYRVYEKYVTMLEAVRHYYAMPKSRVIETVQEHYLFLEAIKAKDLEKLESAVKHHSENSRIRFELYKKCSF